MADMTGILEPPVLVVKALLAFTFYGKIVFEGLAPSAYLTVCDDIDLL